MGEFVVEFRQDGTVPIPPDVARRLGLHPGDNLVMRMAEDRMELVKLAMTAREATEDLAKAETALHSLDDRRTL